MSPRCATAVPEPPDGRRALPHAPGGCRKAAEKQTLAVGLGEKCATFRRPKGAKGRMKTDFMWPADAFVIIDEADSIDAEFGLYLHLLLYTGIRKSEGLDILSADVRTDERAAWLRDSKNEDQRMLKLRDDILAPLQAHLNSTKGERLFRFNDGGHFKHYLLRAKLAVCGLPCPKRRPTGWKPPDYRLAFVGFHLPAHLGDVDAPLRRDGRPGACRHQELARSEKRGGRNGTASTTCRPWGLDGEKPPTSRIHQSIQWRDFSPPRVGRNFCH